MPALVRQHLNQRGVHNRTAFCDLMQCLDEVGDVRDPTLEQVSDTAAAGQ